MQKCVPFVKRVFPFVCSNVLHKIDNRNEICLQLQLGTSSPSNILASFFSVFVFFRKWWTFSPNCEDYQESLPMFTYFPERKRICILFNISRPRKCTQAWRKLKLTLPSPVVPPPLGTIKEHLDAANISILENIPKGTDLLEMMSYNLLSSLLTLFLLSFFSL